MDVREIVRIGSVTSGRKKVSSTTQTLVPGRLTTERDGRNRYISPLHLHALI